MSVAWPFTGREAELSQVRGILAGGGNVVLCGGAGVGKSRLAVEAARGATRIRANEAAKALPLGAFGPLLPGEVVAENLLGWAGQAVREAAGRVLVIDDAHLLDAASAALTQQLAESGQQLVVTVRNGEPCPEPVVALWREGIAARVEVAELSEGAVTALLAEVLGGAVELESVRRLLRLSHGNALYLRELVDEAIGRGTLAESGGVWRWQGAVPMSRQLKELISARIGELTEAESAVLELVALGEPLGLGALLTVGDAAAVETAEERGLIAVTAEDEQRNGLHGSVVRLAHPLYGESVRAGMPRLRTVRRYRQLAELGVESSTRQDVLRLALWRLEAGLTDRPEPLLAALRMAWAAHDYPLAERFGWAAVEAGAGPEAAILLAPVLGYGGKIAEADALLERLWEEPCDERTRTLMISTRLNILATLGRVEEAIAIVEAAEVTLTAPENRQELMFWQSSIHFGLGRYDKALTLADSIVADPVSGPMRAQGHGQRAWILIFMGRPVDSLAEVRRVLDTRAEWESAVPVYVRALQGIQQFAAYYAGDLEAEADAVAFGDVITGADSDWAVADAESAYALGILERHRGRIRTAARLLGTPSGGDALSDYQTPRLAEFAMAAAISGDIETAERALEQAKESATLVAMTFSVDLARPWVLAARGELTKAADLAVGNAERMREIGSFIQEVVACHDALRLGSGDRVAARLIELGTLCQGEFASAAAEHAAAGNDGAALLAVSERFERLGFLLHAADAAAQAAHGFETAGRTASARSAAARAHALATACEGVSTPALARLTAPNLTPRESEIARLAAKGLANKEIAVRLVVSVRTVENHLHTAYQKLGVTSRAELTRVLGSGNTSR